MRCVILPHCDGPDADASGGPKLRHSTMAHQIPDGSASNQCTSITTSSHFANEVRPSGQRANLVCCPRWQVGARRHVRRSNQMVQPLTRNLVSCLYRFCYSGFCRLFHRRQGYIFLPSLDSSLYSCADEVSCSSGAEINKQDKSAATLPKDLQCDLPPVEQSMY